MKEKVSFSVFRRSGHHSHHSVAERESTTTKLSASASTADRKRSWTVWKKEQGPAALRRSLYILDVI